MNDRDWLDDLAKKDLSEQLERDDELSFLTAESYEIDLNDDPFLEMKK